MIVEKAAVASIGLGWLGVNALAAVATDGTGFVDWANLATNAGMAGLVVLLLLKTGPQIIAAFKDANKAVVDEMASMKNTLHTDLTETQKRYLDMLEKAMDELREKREQ